MSAKISPLAGKPAPTEMLVNVPKLVAAWIQARANTLIDRVTRRPDRKLFEAPVGFKWVVDGLFDGSLGFGGVESAGASVLRRDGSVWATDKEGIVPALLAAEIAARTGRDPGERYRDLVRELGEPCADRVEAR